MKKPKITIVGNGDLISIENSTGRITIRVYQGSIDVMAGRNSENVSKKLIIKPISTNLIMIYQEN